MARVAKMGTPSQIFLLLSTRSSGIQSGQRGIENRNGIDSDVLLDQMGDLKPRRLLPTEGQDATAGLVEFLGIAALWNCLSHVTLHLNGRATHNSAVNSNDARATQF